MPRKKKQKAVRSRIQKRKTTAAIKKQEPISTGKKNITFRWGESYTSFLLGIVAVIIAVLFVASFLKAKHTQQITSMAITPTVEQTTNNKLPMQSPTKIITNTPIATSTLAPTQKPTTVPTKEEKEIQTKTLPTQQKTYIVKPGDDLWHIAVNVYNDGYRWVDIARANHLDNPGMIFSGNKLVIPAITPTPTAMPLPTVTPTPKVTLPIQQPTVGTAIKGTTYTIQRGDNLWDIAVRAYADGYKWVNIARANNLDNPGIIHAGNILKIPR